MVSIRDARLTDLDAIEDMISDFVKGHPAESHRRSREALQRAYFGDPPVAHLLVAERDGRIVGMGQWRLIHDMFWGFFGAEAEWLYVRPECRGSGIALAIVTRICAQARAPAARTRTGAWR